VVGGWVGSWCQLTQVTKLCAQWARQMATTALIIPQAVQTYNRTELDPKLPYQCPSRPSQGLLWSFVTWQGRQQAVCKSRPAYLYQFCYCVWIVHECDYYNKQSNGFQFLCIHGQFSQIQSQLLYLLILYVYIYIYIIKTLGRVTWPSKVECCAA